MSYFHKPENALKRAEELIEVGQTLSAADTLEAVIRARRHRQTWSPSLEQIMNKLIEICVEKRDGKRAKEALIQYRQIALAVQPASLESVARRFLELAETAAQKAQAKLETFSLEGVDDLEAQETPEGLLLSAMRGDAAGDRVEREDVTQWLRFQWEAYRNVLDVLKNNAKLEEMYTVAAKGAFEFCHKYKRNTEFRRLCDLLRNHLASLAKFGQQLNSSLGAADTLQLHLEARFAQLKTACDLELWQEAFRSAEDLHGLMTLLPKSPKPQLLQTYYTKLAQIFWVSGNHLFHAYALYKLYLLARNPKSGASADQQQELASQLLLAALCIAPSRKASAAFEVNVLDKEKSLRMASLLGHSKTPKREALLPELVSKGIENLCLPELKQLYNVLEAQFHPLDMTSKVASMIDFIKQRESLQRYVKPLQRTMLLRLLLQLSEVYTTVTLDSLSKLANFATMHELEKDIIDAVSKGHVNVRIDHKNKILNFHTPQADAEIVRQQLSSLASGLSRAVALVDPGHAAALAERKKTRMAKLSAGLAAEHEATLKRRTLIEQRKEAAERAEREAAEQEKARLEEEQRQMAENERKRLEEEKLQRLELEKQKEREKREREEKKKIMEQVAGVKSKMSGHTAEVKEADVEKVKDLTKAELVAKEKAELEKARTEFALKMTRLSTRIDHTERARREEQKPMLIKREEQARVDHRAAYETTCKQIKENAEKQHAHDMAEKKRLVRMQADRDDFVKAMKQRREAAFVELQAAHKAKMEQERQQRREARARRRQEEEERRKREEEEAARRAEEDRKQAEEDRKRREEEEQRRAERQRRLFGGNNPASDDALAKQQQRLAQVEEKYGGAGGRSDRPDGGRGGYGDRGGDRFGGGDRGGDRFGGGGGGGSWRDRQSGGGGEGGDRGGDRFGGGGDRGGDRFGGGDRGGDRFGGGRYGGGDRGGDRYGDRGGDRGGDRYGGGDRGGDRYGDRGGDRFGGGGDRGGDRFGGGGGGGSVSDGSSSRD